jgi:hypothetical protein
MIETSGASGVMGESGISGGRTWEGHKTITPRKVDKPLVLYGYGKLGHLAEEIFNELKIPIHMIIDNAMPTYFVLNPEDGEPLPRNEVLVAVCVATEPYSGIDLQLKKWGFEDIVPVWDILEAYADRTGINNGWMVVGLSPVEMGEIACVYQGFSDLISRRCYNAFIQWRQNHAELDVPVEPNESLPSTLADIRARQKAEIIYIVGGQYPIIIHNEGHEMETLERNIDTFIDTFKENRPILHVACYHSRDGLWKIEKFLMDNLNNYAFTFRLHGYMGQAAYIYGVPNTFTDNI